MRKMIRGCAVLILTFLVASGCSKPTAEPTTLPQVPAAVSTGSKAPQKTKVMVYTSMPADNLTAFDAIFAQNPPGFEVEWVTKGGSEHLIQKLESEFNANLIEADVVMVAEPSYSRYMMERDRLLPYKPKGFDKVLGDKDPNGHFFSVRGLNVVIVYNTDLVKPDEAPKSFQELLEPKWKNQVVMADPLKSGSSFAAVAALVKKYGWEYFEKAKANGWNVGGGSSAAPKKMYEGQYKVAVMVEQYYITEKAKGKPIALVWPEDGSIFIESPFAIVKGGPNPEGAKRFADWILTPAAQQVIVDGGMHPVVPGLPTPTGSKPVDEVVKNAILVDWDDLAKEKEEYWKKIPAFIDIKS